MSCDPNAFNKIDEIEELNETDKQFLKDILQEELRGGKNKRRKRKLSKRNKKQNKKTRRQQKGGDACDNLACASLLGSIIFIGYGIAACAYSGSYVNVVHFALDGFSAAFNIIFGITAFSKYNAVANDPTKLLGDRQAAAHAGQWDVLGRLNGIYGYAGRIVGYIKKLKTKGVSCRNIIPDPLFDFLKILCEVKNEKITEEEAKKQIADILQPIQDSRDIINIEGNSIIIKNMNPSQVIKINIELLSSLARPTQSNVNVISQDHDIPIEMSQEPEQVSHDYSPPTTGLRHRIVSPNHSPQGSFGKKDD
jgi:hypothetical protein